MFKISNISLSSFEELCFLLDRGYAKKSALNIVSNRYNYSENERSVLNRITMPLNYVERINKSRIIDPSKLENKILSIDTYNQFTTFQSILNNEPILLCRDKIIRDIFSLIHTKNDLQFLQEPIEKYILSIYTLKPSYSYFYFDQQRSMSGVHSSLFRATLEKFKLSGECIVTKSVDHALKARSDSITFTHDSIILNNVPASFDFIDWYIKTNKLKSKIIDRFFKFSIQTRRSFELENY